MKPAVSVVIPAYNAAQFLEKTLDSVRAQTFSSYEIVIVDDGSQDATQAVAEGYLARHGLKGLCLRQENKKIAGARNTGIRAAQADLIALLDHDDLWYPEKLAVVMEEFQRHPEADLVCHDEDVARDGKVLHTTRNGPQHPRMYERLLFQGNALSPSACVLRKDKALSIGGFRENPEFNTVEDYDFWMRLSRVACFRFIPRALGRYQLVERAASRRVEYHHANLEALLRDHFLSYYGETPGWPARLRMARRLACVHRSALGQLMQYGESPELQRRHAVRMLCLCPWDPKNLGRALAWGLGK